MEWCVCGEGGGKRACVCVFRRCFAFDHVSYDPSRSQYKRSEMTKKKKSKTILPIPSAARDTSSVPHPRIRMSNLCIGTIFVVLSMLLLSWNEVCGLFVATRLPAVEI